MSKFLIGLGCSFTQGQGALKQEVIDYYGKQVWKGNHSLPLDKHEREGSWVNQICKRYLKDYTPVNLGERGMGNRGAIKSLQLHTKHDFESAEDIIVIFMLSGMERFDFPQKDYKLQNHNFYTMFPHPDNKGNPYRSLWDAYAKHVWSEQMVCVETIMNVIEAQVWCKANNAKLLLTSAFDTNINIDFFKTHIFNSRHDIIDKFEWDYFFEPMGFDTIMHMLIHKEENGSPEVNKLKNGGYWDKYPKMTKNGSYITPCCHPNIRGHKAIANVLYKELLRREYV